MQHAEGGGPPFTLRVQSGPTYRVRVVEGKPVPLEGALLTASLANVANENAELADELHSGVTFGVGSVKFFVSEP